MCRPYEPEDLILRSTNVPFVPDAREPRQFHQLLNVIFGQRDLLTGTMHYSPEQRYLQRRLGAMLGHKPDQKVMVWFGDGNNGKTLLQKIVYKVMGDYAQWFTPTLLSNKVADDKLEYRIAALQGIRCLMISELPERINLARLKLLTDPVQTIGSIRAVSRLA